VPEDSAPPTDRKIVKARRVLLGHDGYPRCVYNTIQPKVLISDISIP
jgi:hypothetical protein